MSQRIRILTVAALLFVQVVFADKACDGRQTISPPVSRKPKLPPETQLQNLPKTRATSPKKQNRLPSRQQANPLPQRSAKGNQVIIEATVWSVNHSSKDLLDELQKRFSKSNSGRNGRSKIISELRKRNRVDVKSKPADLTADSSRGMRKEFIGSLSELERELLHSMISRVETANGITSPTIITMDGRPASVFAGSEVPFTTGAETTERKVNFMAFGVKLDVLPKVKSGETVEISYKFELKQKLDDEVAQTLLNAQKSLQKLYAPVISKDGKITGERLVFQRPDEPQLLFEMSRTEGNSDVKQSNTLAIIASDSTPNGKPKSSYLIFLTPTKLTEGKLSQNKNLAPPVQAKPTTPVPTPTVADTKLPEYANLKPPHPARIRSAELNKIAPVLKPVENSRPIDIAFDLPKGFKVNAGDLLLVDNQVKVDRRFELLKLTIEGKLDGRDVSFQTCLLNQSLGSCPAKAKLTMVLTENKIRTILKEKHFTQIIWAPNVTDLSQVPADRQLFLQAWDVPNRKTFQQEATQDGVNATALIALYKEKTAIVDDKYTFAESFPIGLIWKAMASADNGQLHTRSMQIKQAFDSNPGQCRLMDLYGAISKSSQLHLIKNDCPVVIEESSSRLGTTDISLVLSAKDALAFDQAKQNGRVELLPLNKRQNNVAKAGYVQPTNAATGYPDPYSTRSNLVGNSPLEPSSTKNANVMTEIKSMRDDVATLKSDVKRLIQLLENLKEE